MSLSASIADFLNELFIHADERDGRIVSGKWIIIGSNTRFPSCQLILTTRSLFNEKERIVAEVENMLKENPSMDMETACVSTLAIETSERMYRNILQGNNKAILDYVKNCRALAHKDVCLVTYTDPTTGKTTEQYSGHGALLWMSILQSVPKEHLIKISYQMMEANPRILTEEENRRCALHCVNEFVSKLYNESTEDSLRILRREAGL